jgi:hypothetical protein
MKRISKRSVALRSTEKRWAKAKDTEDRPGLTNGMPKDSTSRGKLLVHDLRDGTRWQLNDGTSAQYPNQFQVFHGDGSVGSLVTNFSIDLLEVQSTGNQPLRNYLIANYHTANFSWNHGGDVSITISLYNIDGRLLFGNVAAFPVGRGACHYDGGFVGHQELMITPASIIDVVDQYQLHVPVISGVIGPC